MPFRLKLTCFPEETTGTYNSNSYISGLLKKARLPDGAKMPEPWFPRALSDRFPGWKTLVPALEFNDRP